ncbi:class I SAM-dependent methyltransferase [Clostridium sp. Marseille-QA1073]
MKGKNVSDTEIEVNFLKKHLPISNYKKILDLCCGYGRHSNMLGEYGYNVLGIDRDEDALIKAEKSANKNVEYLSYDMRNIEKLPYSFDGIISMWHSFGYFNDDVNISIIKQISSLLNKNGRFILDIYNKDFLKRMLERENLLKKIY